MPAEPIFFDSITIESFRGFRHRQSLDLSASAVIVRGPNGTGKTSLFDAFEWLLMGDIPRLAALALRRNDEFVVNTYSEGPATVGAVLRTRDRLVEIQRSGDRTSSSLSWTEGSRVISGAQAETELRKLLLPQTESALDAVLLTSALLQQDVVRAVLQSKPAERYELISGMLGFDSIERFEVDAEAKYKSASEAVKDAERRLAEIDTRAASEASVIREIELRASSRPPVESARTAVIGLLEKGRLRPIADPKNLGANTAQSLGSQARLLAESLRRHATGLSAGAGEVVNADLDQRRAKSIARLHSLELEAKRMEERNAAAMRASDEDARLVALVTPLLTDHCPVCGQAIDRKGVEKRLRERSQQSTQLAEIQRDKARIEDQLRAERSELTSIDTEIASTRLASDRLASSRAAVASLLQRGPLLTIPSEWDGDPNAARSLADEADALAGAVDLLTASISAAAAAEDLARRRLAQLQVSQEAAALRRQIELLQKEQGEARLLAEAAKQARLEVIRKRFVQLNPLVSEVWERLAPHPTFSRISLEFEMYRSRGTTWPMVEDSEFDVRANPQLVFSSAQTNVVALSYFLAMGFAMRDASLPFVLMDDPLQSMDDVNALGFSDLCRFIRKQRQLIISTHEERLADLLERKLTPRVPAESTLCLEFRGWGRDGPLIESRRVEPQILDGRLRVVVAA